MKRVLLILGSSYIWYGNKISRSEELEAKSIQNKTVSHKTTKQVSYTQPA